MNGIDIPAYFWSLATLGLCLMVFPALDPAKPVHRLIVSGVTLATIFLYLFWRVSATLIFDGWLATTICLGFLLLEFISATGEILVLIVLTRHRSRTRDVARNAGWLRAEAPKAAIFIATYNEGVSILERTITGALNQSYKAKIYLLDDGRRPEVADLCRRRGVEWLTRSDNRHAKAGNMNAGLQTLAARGELPEFIAILDADFVALPNFMARCLTLFRDPAVGVVQTPQHFFNPDPLQHRIKGHLDLPDEQRFFFDTLLPAKDAWGTAFSCGTSSVVRTSALLEIGGFPTESITEDMLLSIRMKLHGHGTAYLNEQLSLGLAPEGIGEYCTQRVRWCVGAMQIMRGTDGLFKRNGLRPIDRISQFETLLYWTGGFAFRVVCFLVPVLYWLTGMTVMDASIELLAIFLIPRILVEGFAIAWYSNGRLMPVLTDAQQLLIAPEVVAASVHTLLFPGERPFKVTNKGGSRTEAVVHWRFLWRFAAVLTLTAGGMLASYYTPLAPAFFSDQKGLVAFWSVYNILICIIGIIVCVETPRRTDERTPIDGRSPFIRRGEAVSVDLIDLSSTGVAFANDGTWAIGDSGVVTLPELGDVPATVARVTDQIVGARIEMTPQQLITLTSMQFSGKLRRTAKIGAGQSFIALLRGLTTH